MTPLTITCRTHAYSSSGAGIHGIIMVFVGLNVGPEFETNMMLECDVVSLDEVTWGIVRESAVIVKKSIDPEDSVAQQMNK